MPTREEIENDAEIQQFVNEIESENSHDDFDDEDEDVFGYSDDDLDEFDLDDDDETFDTFERIGRNQRGEWYE
jgi:hypothetical protein